MSRFIEGQDRNQVTLLPECLDDFIADDNPVRVVDAFIGELDMVALGFEGVLSHCRLMKVVWAGTNASSSIWTDFPCQCTKLVGKRQLDTAFRQKLTFANHVHQLDAGQDAFGGAK